MTKLRTTTTISHPKLDLMVQWNCSPMHNKGTKARADLTCVSAIRSIDLGKASIWGIESALTTLFHPGTSLEIRLLPDQVNVLHDERPLSEMAATRVPLAGTWRDPFALIPNSQQQVRCHSMDR